MAHQALIELRTAGRGLLDITARVDAVVAESGITTGVCQVFVQHTSASLVITENADPDVQRDLETFMARIAPDGDPDWLHDAEGPDDMPAHIRSVLTQTSLSIPAVRARLGLGTWQGVFLWEHRARAHRRRVVITVTGD